MNDDLQITMTYDQYKTGVERVKSIAYERGVTAGFDEAIDEVKRGEIDPQTYKRNVK